MFEIFFYTKRKKREIMIHKRVKKQPRMNRSVLSVYTASGTSDCFPASTLPKSGDKITVLPTEYTAIFLNKKIAVIYI